jgi:addiction module HigA family antidote
LFDLCWRSLATEKTQAAIVYFKTPGLDSRLGRVCKIPGEILSHEFMEPLGLSGNALALALRVPANRITAIVNGERAISADTAHAAGALFRNDARVLDQHAGRTRSIEGESGKRQTDCGRGQGARLMQRPLRFPDAAHSGSPQLRSGSLRRLLMCSSLIMMLLPSEPVR